MQDEADRAEAAARTRKVVVWLVIALLIAAAIFFYVRSVKHEAIEKPAAEGEAERTPLTRNPVPEPTPEQTPSGLTPYLPASLPDLNNSDPAMLKLADYLIKNPDLAQLLVSKDIIRRLVVTIDNLGGRAVPINRLPVRPPDAPFVTGKVGEQIVIDPRNYPRYRKYVALLDGLDSHDAANAYIHFYPLFQQAYRELGYPQGFFNDRLIAVIDNLLQTPAVRGPIGLEQPVVFYTYADPKLEALSAGQRLLLRMGPDNASTIKHKLSELRQELTK